MVSRSSMLFLVQSCNRTFSSAIPKIPLFLNAYNKQETHFLNQYASHFKIIFVFIVIVSILLKAMRIVWLSADKLAYNYAYWLCTTCVSNVTIFLYNPASNGLSFLCFTSFQCVLVSIFRKFSSYCCTLASALFFPPMFFGSFWGSKEVNSFLCIFVSDVIEFHVSLLSMFLASYVSSFSCC